MKAQRNEQPRIAPHPVFEEMSDKRLQLTESLIEVKIDQAKQNEDQSVVSWYECEMSLLQAERARRNGGEKKSESLVLTMDQIKPEKIEWLWRNRIPLKYLTTVDGDPGIGKSYLTLAVAAAVTTGNPLPGGDKSTPANVFLLSMEDGLADTIRPRLDQLGADVSRVVVPNPKRGFITAFLNDDFIRKAVKEVGPKLVIIDPMIAFVGKADPDKAGQVRGLLSPLMRIAEEHCLAILIVRHFTKITDRKAMHSGSGSVDWVAAVRSGFIITESDDEPDMRVLAQHKSNQTGKAPSVTFYIDDKGFR